MAARWPEYSTAAILLRVGRCPIRLNRRAEPFVQVDQVAWIQENPKTLKRQPLVDQAPQLSPGRAGFEERKPLVHGLEII